MRFTFPRKATDYSHAIVRLPKEERLMRMTTTMTSKLLATLSALLLMAGFVSIAHAAPIAITNAGFETPAGSDGVLDDVVDASITPATGWTKSGGGQIYNPGLNANAPEGSNSYVILDGIPGYDLGSGSVLQVLDDVLREGTYTLDVEVGENATAASVFGTAYEVEIGVMAGGTFQALANDPTPVTPSNGFETSTAVLDANGHASLGLPLAIRLSGSVASGTNNQVLFDNVRLDFVAAPADVDVYLQTQAFDKALPGGGTVPMWGFASCTSGFASCELPADSDAPGPQINAFEGFQLRVHVQNTLNLPVSLIIPGQTEVGGGTPMMMGNRVRSFTTETVAATGGIPGAETIYTFSNLNAGTFLYQSGTLPSIQVPMGLYGALVVADTTPGTAYGYPYDAEAVLLLSEIDPLQNNRVNSAAATTPDIGVDCVPLAEYEQNMTAGYPCTVDYDPMYFLINGEPTVDLPAGDPADTALLRLLNAGLRSHTPSVVGVEMGLIAEDGNAYPGQPRQHSAVLLAAGKTLDAIIDMPNEDQTYSLFDRMPTFSNENLPNGGSLANLQVGTGTPPVSDPISLAENDAYEVVEDMPLIVGGAGVLGNDNGLTTATAVSDVAHGTLECVTSPTTSTPGICSNGTFTYTPNADYSGPDSFTYSASDGISTYGAQVMLSVSFVNDDPVAADDAYQNYVGNSITVNAPGVLGNDADADGDQLFAVWKSGTVTLAADGSFTADAGGSFTYAACDREVNAAGVCTGSESDPVTVDVTINPPSGISLVLEESDGTAVTAGYRWTLEEDTTFQPDPDNIDQFGSQATTFHKSYMPVVAQGCVGAGACSDGEAETPFSQAALEDGKHYYVSVLPADAMAEDSAGNRVGHTVGGAQIAPGASSVTVKVNREPLPYAQISIFVFNDSGPTNGAVDLNESGLGGFQVTLEDAGGRYGMSAGQMMQDADGNNLVNALDCFGGAPQSQIISCPDTQANRDAGLVGRVLIQKLWPGKYGIITVPGASSGKWVQTSTIEGTKVIDAWVKANEPPFFSEFGPVGVHAFVGFVNPETIEASRTGLPAPNGVATITGAVTNKHMSRPPEQTLWDSGTYDALAHTQAWIGLNTVGGRGANIAAVQATYDEGTGVASFTIPDVPRGFDYQIVVWDAYLDQVIAYRTVTAAELDAGGDVGNISVFQWFARLENHVFLDENRDGIKDANEGPLAEQAVNIRWRDGTMYQSFPTDLDGFVPFDQVFPFFAWLVAEVDYARYDATGLTVRVDAGGDVSGTGHVLNPQLQNPDDPDSPCVDATCTSRVEAGQVLTQGFQAFLGQTNVFEWGKAPYEPGSNGGISGIVYYGVTRAEADPRRAAAEVWEPGIPRVPVRLYRVVNQEASSIFVANPGFEIPSGGNGIRDINVDGSNGWSKTGGGQIFNPGNNSNAPEGSNSYIILDGPFNNFSLGSGSVEQQLTDVLTEGSYSLSVQVGENATSRSVFGTGYQVQFGVNSTNGFVLLAEDNSSLAPSAGFLTSTVTYTVDTGNDYLGMPLVIRLVGQVEPGLDNQVLFDDVRLDYSTTGLALVQETLTDSWDDSLPTGCPGADVLDSQIVGPGPNDATGDLTTKCYDGLRNFNQARPAVFDGGYAFNDIPAGEYVVEIVPPPGYELTKEEDVNVGYGDGYATPPITVGGAAEIILPDPAMVEAALLDVRVGLAQPPCVGEMRTVPQTMSLFPATQEAAPFRGADRPLCDRKKVILSDQGQAAADFTLHTDAPIAAHFAGMILDDIAQEFNPLSPQFGEKWAPPFVPVSVRDYKGNEIARVYSDQWGRMDGLMPSTFTANTPAPSGFSPAMHQTCMNDPGPIMDNDPTSLTFGTMIVDPQYNPAYSNFCYTFQYMPGATTYLDTPVVPVSAFASGYNAPDCSLNAGTPMISVVDGDRDNGIGPMLQRRAIGGVRGTLTITSMGTVEVPNPAYEGPLNLAAGAKTIERDYGFGPDTGAGSGRSVRIGNTELEIITWSDSEIVARAVQGLGSGQLVVTRGDNLNSSEQAITVTVYGLTPPAHTFVSSGESIQAAIDAANLGDLIMVEPGVYNESVIMWKPVRLQGAGAGSTMINATKRPTEILAAWRQKMDDLFALRPREVDSLPNQLDGAAGFTTSEGAAITVLGRDTNGSRGFLSNSSRIDGFGITGGDVGGGILINGYAHNLEVSNNNVYGNSGTLHGGIRVGVPYLELQPPQAEPGENNSTYELNTGVSIHHNAVTRNGGLGGAGGGISLSTGSDQYRVSNNFVCGNFTKGDGGGIAHLGLSDNGQIRDNKVLYNQSFNQAVTVSGGGVFVGGEPVIVEFIELDNPNQLSTGSGSVDIRDNLIQGNSAAAGHGGGIRTQYVNGWDIGITGDRPKWYRIRILDNVIVNNHTGWAGGGISLHNTVKGVLRRNTVAHNDSTATVGGLIVNNLSAKQPAGIATEPHSIALAAAIAQYDGNNTDRDWSTPAMGNPNDNIVVENRSFNYEVVGGDARLSPILAQANVGDCDARAVYWDYDARILSHRAVDSGVAGGPTGADPGFVAPYCNGGRTLASPTPGPMFALPALDEGGNAWIDVRFGPLTPVWPADGTALPFSYEVTP